MSKVYVMGDCHTARSYSHHIIAGAPKNFVRLKTWKMEREIEDTNISLKMWGRSGYKCWGVDFYKDYLENTLSSEPEDLPDIPGITDNLQDQFGFQEIKSADLVMPWMGYIDSRNFIPDYNDAEEVVKQYVDKTLDFFKLSKIRFIEPFPQFEVLGMPGYDQHSYEKKCKANDDFIKYLHYYSDLNGLMKPVSQQLVYDSIGSQKIEKRHAKLAGPIYNYGFLDGLRFEHNKSIYNNLINEIKLTVDYYKL